MEIVYCKPPSLVVVEQEDCRRLRHMAVDWRVDHCFHDNKECYLLVDSQKLVDMEILWLGRQDKVQVLKKFT